MKDATIKHQREVQLVVFKIANEEFGVSIAQVREIVRLVPITPIPRAPDFIEGVVNLRGQIIAVIDLSKRLDMPAAASTDKTRIIVVDVESNIVGMIVDEVTEVLRMAVDNITAAPELISGESKNRYITGVGKLEDRLLVLMDLAKVLSPEEVEDIRTAGVIGDKPTQAEKKK